MPKFEIAIDQDICISCGLCEEIEPSLFFNGDDGLAYVKDADSPRPKTPQYYGILGRVTVPEALLDSAVEAVENCPVECIDIGEAEAAAAS